jgi:glycosyltransferase involved in cell wall biosynthesis
MLSHDVHLEATVRVTVIVPAYNEAGNVHLLVEELAPALAGLAAEILVVDDGSSDGTADRVPNTAPFRCLRLPRSGKTAALEQGFRAARGERIVTIDADLQEDPRHIRDLVALLDHADCALGVRRDRRDPLLTKKLPSRAYNLVVGLWFGRHFEDIDCGLRAFRRAAIGDLAFFEGAHRVFPLMVHRAGGRVATMVVRHRERRFEAAKFSSPLRFVRGFAALAKVQRMKRRAPRATTLGVAGQPGR